MKIGLTGDVMIGRLVNKQLASVDPSYLWGDVLPLLQSTDFNLINLEAVIGKSKKKVPKIFNFKADPKRIDTLVDGTIHAVNLANNHTLDYDVEGLLETIEILDQYNILHTGAGRNSEEASLPILAEVQGIKIGILGYTDNEPSWIASERSPGTRYLQINEEGLKQVQSDISRIREQVDLLIITIHWGPNMRERPPQHFIDFSHGVIDAGADVFHGHSAHIFQGIEIYQGKPILYDTGDFVDDYAVDPFLRNDRSFFFILEVNRTGIVSLKLIPTKIDRCQVNLSMGEDCTESIKRMTVLSKEFGTSFQVIDHTLVYSMKDKS